MFIVEIDIIILWNITIKKGDKNVQWVSNNLNENENERDTYRKLEIKIQYNKYFELSSPVLSYLWNDLVDLAVIVQLLKKYSYRKLFKYLSNAKQKHNKRI